MLSTIPLLASLFLGATQAHGQIQIISSFTNLTVSAGDASTASNCFPAVGFQMPSSTPASLNGWWCDTSTEYAWVGFSYEVTACKHPDSVAL